MKKHNIFFYLFFLLFPIYLFSEDKPEKIVSNFFNLYLERGINTSIDYLFSNNPVLYQKTDSIRNLKNTITNIEKVLGKFYGYKIIENYNLDDALEIHIALVRYEKQPLRFLFVFYKPDTKWITYRFEIDTNFPDNYIDIIFFDNKKKEKN